jgi:hypothetical protein
VIPDVEAAARMGRTLGAVYRPRVLLGLTL